MKVPKIAGIVFLLINCVMAVLCLWVWADVLYLNPGNNHSFLLGTWIERIIMRHGLLLALCLTVPFGLPFLLNRKPGNLAYIVVGGALAALYLLSFRLIED